MLVNKPSIPVFISREGLIKSKNYECRADKCSASANNSGGCATFIHPTILNQGFPKQFWFYPLHQNKSFYDN